MTAVATIPALAEVRKRAAELFEARGFPTSREEEWRFTNVSPIARAHFAITPPRVNGHSLRAALEQRPEIIEEHLARYASCESNGFCRPEYRQFRRRQIHTDS